jgi:hypothetical protein
MNLTSRRPRRAAKAEAAFEPVCKNMTAVARWYLAAIRDGSRRPSPLALTSDPRLLPERRLDAFQ